MKTNTLRKHLADAVLAITLAWLSSAPGADTPAYKLGLDVNCPSGLGE